LTEIFDVFPTRDVDSTSFLVECEASVIALHQSISCCFLSSVFVLTF